MIECNLDENKKRCTCTYEPRNKKGKCCECIRYQEKTYDRSLRRFIACHQ